MPAKLNPLWYSPLLPVFFFLTAVSVGLAMVILESSASARAFHRGLELPLLGRLARAIPFVLGLYLVIELGDLAAGGKLGLLLPNQPLAVLLWVELIAGVAIPIVLFSRRAVRQSPKGLLVGALLIIGGVMLNRFDVSLLAQSISADRDTSPAWGSSPSASASFRQASWPSPSSPSSSRFSRWSPRPTSSSAPAPDAAGA